MIINRLITLSQNAFNLNEAFLDFFTLFAVVKMLIRLTNLLLTSEAFSLSALTADSISLHNTFLKSLKKMELESVLTKEGFNAKLEV